MLNKISNETSLVRTVEFIKSSTRIAPKTSSEDLDTLNYKELSGRLIINREYQRNFIQSKESASAYIESIFLGLIIPEIQVFEDYDTGNREIIDGQQRVLSLLKFYRGEYCLRKLKEMPELNGLYFNQLPKELQNILKGFQINIRTFTNSDELYKYLLFERLNTGTKKLTSQEVRNCVYRGKLLDTAKEIAETDDVKELLFGVKNERFQRVEVVLNIMTLINLFENEEQKELLHSDLMKVRINKFLEFGKEFSDDRLLAMKERFMEVTKFVLRNFDLRHASKLMYPETPNYSVVKTLCESLCVAFNSYDLSKCEQYIEEIRMNIYNVFTSRAYKESLGISSGKNVKAILIRNELIENAIEEAYEVRNTMQMQA